MLHTAKISKRTDTPSEYGTESYSWAKSGLVSGFMDIISIEKGMQSSKIIEDSTHIFITTKIVDVKTGDRLEIKGKSYEVNHVDNPMMMNHHLEIELKLTQEQMSQTDYYVYFGTIDGEEIDEMAILDFENQKMKERMFTGDFKGTKTTLVIAYPKELGKASIRVNNKLVTNWNVQVLMVNGTTHYVYSTKVEKGNIHIDLF